MKSIREILPEDARIQTAQLSVQPDYQYEERKAPRITGYTVTNVVRFETRELKRVSELIDRAMRAGANNVQSLQFRVTDERALRAEALRKALADASAQAEVIAKALKLRILRVLSVQAQALPPPIIYPERAMAPKSAEAPTPVDPGSINLQASVTLTVEIGK